MHEIADSTKKLVKDEFVNDGVPSAPLVTREQMAQATVQGDGSKKLNENLIK
nr:MAG TPA: hypothetical protein [Caudoviricetes sp.]